MWTDKGELNSTFTKYHPILTKYGCTDDDVLNLQNMWNEPHRVYHNQEHLEEILGLIENLRSTRPNMTEVAFDIFVLAAFFHDAVYDPKSKTNEEDSAELFLKTCYKATDIYNTGTIEVDNPAGTVTNFVYAMILDTKDHTKNPSSYFSGQFLIFDLNGMINGSVSRMIADEGKIMREFGFVDFDVYKNVRGTMFLDKFATHIKSINKDSKVEEYIDWYKNRTPKIAVFAGSFFPFHRGHHDILKRAERIFDKVIVLLCINPSKNNNSEQVKEYIEKDLSKKLPNNQIEFFSGMVHEYVKSKNYPLSVVKGLRNASDFDSEKLQLRYMEDFYPDINIVYIVSDRKFEHVSSTGVKQIQSFGANADHYLLD